MGGVAVAGFQAVPWSPGSAGWGWGWGWGQATARERTYLIDADLGLHILQSLLQDGDEGSRRHQRPVDVGLADVALDTERECRVGKTCSQREQGAKGFGRPEVKGCGRRSHGDPKVAPLISDAAD